MVQRELTVRTGSSAGTQVSAGPIRTCVGCRKRELATDLLRVVAREIETSGSTVTGPAAKFGIAADLRRRLPGRGAWLHPVLECLRQADRRRAFSRALRVSGTLDISALTQYLSTTGSNTVTEASTQ